MKDNLNELMAYLEKLGLMGRNDIFADAKACKQQYDRLWPFLNLATTVVIGPAYDDGRPYDMGKIQLQLQALLAKDDNAVTALKFFIHSSNAAELTYRGMVSMKETACRIAITSGKKDLVDEVIDELLKRPRTEPQYVGFDTPGFGFSFGDIFGDPFSPSIIIPRDTLPCIAGAEDVLQAVTELSKCSTSYTVAKDDAAKATAKETVLVAITTTEEALYKVLGTTKLDDYIKKFKGKRCEECLGFLSAARQFINESRQVIGEK